MVAVGIASEGDVPEVVETLASAFDAVPIFRWFIPDAERRAAILPAFFAAMCEAYLPWGEIHRSVDGLAAAVWVPPGATPPPESVALLAERVPAAVGEYGVRMREFRPLLDAAHPTFPHWFLHFLAVRPEAQGRGYGSALLRAVLDRVEDTPAYLDATSPDNRRLYERHNFVVQRTLTLRDSPPLWSMLREAR